MPRATTRVPSRKRRKKIIKQARGYFGEKKSNIRRVKEAVDRAGQYAYIHRKKKKADFRGLWIIRINAAARNLGVSYSKLMAGLKQAGIKLNRKVLADLAISNAAAFEKIVALAHTNKNK